MAALGLFTLPKKERLCNRKEIDQLFGGSSRSLAAYPLRVVYTMVPRGQDGVPARMMVSVPKRCFKRAVKRNRVKRQVREAYRRHKDTLTDAMAGKDDRQLLVAFLWIDSRPHDSRNVEAKVENLIRRMAEKI